MTEPDLLYLPSLRIPLILAGPGVPSDGRRIGGFVQLPDVMPTVLSLLGRGSPPETAGVSLAPFLRTGDPVPAREAFSETRFVRYPALAPGIDAGPKIAARDDRFTAVLRVDDRVLEVYDRSSDPGETTDLLSGDGSHETERALQRMLERRLRARLAATSKPGDRQPRVFSSTIRARLERLIDSRKRSTTSPGLW